METSTIIAIVLGTIGTCSGHARLWWRDHNRAKGPDVVAKLREEVKALIKDSVEKEKLSALLTVRDEQVKEYREEVGQIYKQIGAMENERDTCRHEMAKMQAQLDEFTKRS